MKEKYKKYLNNDYKFDKKSMISIISIIIVISGMFGFFYEFIFYYFNSGMNTFYYRGGNFLPFINIYAYGALLIYFLCYKKRKSPLKVFLISLISTGVLELISGYILYDVLGLTRCWSYNEEILNFGNIGGFVCLRSVLFFGLSGLFLIYAIIPFAFYLARHVDKNVLFNVSVSICFIFLIDEVYNLLITKITPLPKASQIYKSFGVKYIYFKR